MALIVEFKQSSVSTVVLHTPVVCGWRVVTANRRRVVQLDTYGSNDRQLAGKTSQTLQLDEEHAAALIGILRTAFPGIES